MCFSCCVVSTPLAIALCCVCCCVCVFVSVSVWHLAWQMTVAARVAARESDGTYLCVAVKALITGSPWFWLLTLFPRRGFPRAPSPSRGTFRPPLWASGEGPGGSRGCPRTARTRTRWPGVARDKALNFLSRPEPMEGRPRRRPKKTLTNGKHGSQFARSRSRAGFGVHS